MGVSWASTAFIHSEDPTFGFFLVDDFFFGLVSLNFRDVMNLALEGRM